MRDAEIQNLCERGQAELMQTDYLAAIDTFISAEQAAWDIKAFDTLCRLYLPFQEARRQARQRCGEGAVRLQECCVLPSQSIDASKMLADVFVGQLLIAGWGSTAPAAELRKLAHQQHRYVETFLGAAFPTTDGQVMIAIIPMEGSPLPTVEPRSTEDLAAILPQNSVLISPTTLPKNVPRGNAESYAIVMDLWEKLHRPFLEAGDRETDPIKKMQAYRLTLQVDPACELAHQNLANVARMLARQR